MRLEIESTPTVVVRTTNVVKLFALTPSKGVVRCMRVAIHDRIKQIQEALGSPGEPMSIPQLALKGGVTRQALNKIVKQSQDGRESGHKALQKCSGKWGYSYDWIMTGRGSMKAQPRDALEQAIESEPWDAAAIEFARALAKDGRQLNEAGWARILRSAHEMASETPPVVKTALTSR